MQPTPKLHLATGIATRSTFTTSSKTTQYTINTQKILYNSEILLFLHPLFKEETIINNI